MKIFLFILLFSSSLSWGLTFKNGEQTEDDTPNSYEKSNNSQIDGAYLLKWETLFFSDDKKTIIDSEPDAIDEVNFVNGKVKNITFNDGVLIANKYRKSTKIKLKKDDIIITGNLDIDCDCPEKVKIILKKKIQDNVIIYEGMAPWGGQDSTEYIKATLTQLSSDNSAFLGDLYKKNLGIENPNDTTLQGWNGWEVTGKKEMQAYENKKNIKLFSVVNSPTRFGETSFFIQAPGDECFQRDEDCKRSNGEKQKRVEARHDTGFEGNVWVSSSLYLPDKFEMPTMKKTLLQFHSDYDYLPPMFMFDIIKSRGLIWSHESAKGINFYPEGNNNCSPGASFNNDDHQFCNAEFQEYSILKTDDIKRNSWYDFVFNINFDNKNIDQAFHKIWMNGKLVISKNNQTLWEQLPEIEINKNKVAFHFGIYGPYLDKSHQEYFADEIHFARNCEDLGIDKLGYSCETLMSQQIKESEPSRKQLGF